MLFWHENAFTFEGVRLMWSLSITSQIISLTTWWQCVALMVHTHCLQAREEQLEPSHPQQLQWQMQWTVKLLFSQWLHVIPTIRKANALGWSLQLSVQIWTDLLLNRQSSVWSDKRCKIARWWSCFWGENLKRLWLNEVLARHLGFVAAAEGWKECYHFQSRCQTGECICCLWLWPPS